MIVGRMGALGGGGGVEQFGGWVVVDREVGVSDIGQAIVRCR